MNKTKIEWLHWPDGRPGYSWNPIQGLCPVGCEYCYARRIYQRFRWDPCLTHVWSGPFPKKAARIFVCSTMELFHSAIRDDWRNRVFGLIEAHPEHTFFILTKFPQNIDRPMPENVFLGATVTEMEDYLRKVYLFKHKARMRFVSYEPILGPMPPVFPIGLDWFIMGRLTGHGNGRNPELNTLKNIVEGCRDLHVPLFMKDNLASIWPGKLIQEYPSP